MCDTKCVMHINSLNPYNIPGGRLTLSPFCIFTDRHRLSFRRTWSETRECPGIQECHELLGCLFLKLEKIKYNSKHFLSFLPPIVSTFSYPNTLESQICRHKLEILQRVKKQKVKEGTAYLTYL